MHQLKTGLLIQMPGRMQSLKGPEINPAVMARLAKVHRQVQQHRAHPGAAHFVRGDEPAQVRAVLVGMGAVNGQGAFHLAVLQHQPQGIALGVVALTKIGQLTRHLGLKWQAKPHQLAVVAGMEFGNPANSAG